MSPLVLLPGLLCDATVWAPQKEGFTGELRVTAFRHFYGHNSLNSMAAAVLDAAPPRFALAGHSMGGRVALEIMRIAPERVERLALFDTGATPASADEPNKRRVLIELARKEGMQALAERWLPMLVHPQRLKQIEFMNALIAMICRATPEIYEAQVRALLTRPDYRPVLPRIACPALVACGRDDLWSDVAQHEEMAAAIPGARLELIDDCAHMSTVEVPGAVSKLLRAWMTGS